MSVVEILRREGDHLVVTIPPDEAARLGLSEGQPMSVDIRPATQRPRLAPDLLDAFEIELREGREALQYLAEH